MLVSDRSLPLKQHSDIIYKFIAKKRSLVVAGKILSSLFGNYRCRGELLLLRLTNTRYLQSVKVRTSLLESVYDLVIEVNAPV